MLNVFVTQRSWHFVIIVANVHILGVFPVEIATRQVL